MANIGGRFLTVFLIIYNINIVFATKYHRYKIDVENEYDRVQSTTVPPTASREASSYFDTLPKAAANSSDNTVQEKREIEDDENERKSNSTLNQIEGHHQYYNSTIVVDKEKVEAYWNKIRHIPPNKMLSHSHRRAKKFTLSFDFPFYGHLVRNVTVAPTGFLFTGDYVNGYIAASQYIAALMANFDTSLSNDSFVRLNDTGSSFTVIWENVYLQEQQDVGKFTFSTTLHKNGDIVFTYFSVPILPEAIQDDKHPVKVGLSDAYIIDSFVYSALRKTIYEYHRVNFANADITNSTIIILKALPTCLEYTDCASCANQVTAFNCSWCPTVNRCSSGRDRQRQNWIEHGCDQHHVTEEDSCPASVSKTFTKEAVVTSEATLITSVTTHSSIGDSVEKQEESSTTDNSNSWERKEGVTAVTANSNDSTVKKEEDNTKEKELNTKDVTENTTLKTVEKNNSMRSQTKNHDSYYNTTFVVDQEKTEANWIEIRNMQPNGMLSQSHRKLLTVVLSFDFPFYGQPIRNISVLTGGFIYTGDNVHSWMEATQYIAPLMANFDTSLSNDSLVRFNDTGSSFTVLWENVYLQDKQDVGKFTFSTTLHKNGDIVFTYFSVPILVNDIPYDKHPIRVGLSDAYVMDEVIYFARRKAIYEYHKISFVNDDITNSTIITLKALPTCLEYTDCTSCVNHVTEFNCSWCPTVNRCSSGRDRQRQNWIEHGCDQHHVSEEDSCPASVSQTFVKEKDVFPSETTLITSVTTTSSYNSAEKEEESSITDNTAQKEEVTAVTANSNDDSVQKEEDNTKENQLNTEDVTDNRTLKTFEKNHLMVSQRKNHDLYYNTTFVVDEEKAEAFWIEIRNMQPNGMLSQSHGKFLTVVLSFDFPFYGQPIRNISVLTGGFIYTGDNVHSWMEATQYIAPLMANFDTSLSNDSLVRFNDTGSSFTVLWENVYLQDKQDVGKFTFSTTLHKNGDIVFTYFSVPILVNDIPYDKHPIRVGLSDAYVMDEVIYFARRKAIYEYHKISFVNDDITNSTIITLKALPTCLEYTDCTSCVNHVTEFNCSWCPTVNRCSSGRDRQRQNWIEHGCDQHHVSEEDSCPASVSQTFVKEKDVFPSETTLITSVTTTSSYNSAEKEEESSITDNTAQKEEVTAVTANSNDDSVQKEEDNTKENQLNTEDVTDNRTLKTFEKNHLMVSQTKNHDRYYNTTFFVDEEKAEAYWIEIRNMQPNGMLSQSHGKFLTVVLSFDFPFYGHLVRNVSVSTGGFIYTDANVHSWMAAIQYIAPLMANFDTSLSNDSLVRFNDSGSSFTVLWENVYLQDKQDVGKFTFSTTLHKNGDIVFTYFSVPILPKFIQDYQHPIKIGLSDAFFIDKLVYFARKKTIYEHHEVSFVNADITNSTIITLKALPTCLEYTDCASCVNHVTAFNCSWCPTVNRCSSGGERQRQNWIEHGCDRHHVTEEDSCPASVSKTYTKEVAVVTSEATLITSVKTHSSSNDSVEKEEESSTTDNSNSWEQKEEVTAVTANSNDNTVQKEEDNTKEKDLNREDVTGNTTLKTFEKNNLMVNQTKGPTMNPV